MRDMQAGSSAPGRVCGVVHRPDGHPWALFCRGQALSSSVGPALLWGEDRGLVQRSLCPGIWGAAAPSPIMQGMFVGKMVLKHL